MFKSFIYDVFQILTDVPFNLWFWFWLLFAPFVVFSVKPEHNVWLRTGRLFVAIPIIYAAMNLSLHTSANLEWKAYEACQDQFPDGLMQQHEECGEINIADGAGIAFTLLFGWIYAAAYLGIWEFLWRRRYRKVIRGLGKSYAGLWASNIVIGFSLFLFIVFPVTLFMMGLASMFFGRL